MLRLQRFSSIFAATALVLILSMVGAYWMGLVGVRQTKAVGSQMAVVHQLSQFYSTLKQAEAEQRAYLLTKRPEPLEACHAAMSQIDGNLADLEHLVATGDLFASEVHTLQQLTKERTAQLSHTIHVRQQGSLEEAAAESQSPERSSTATAIRTLYHHMLAQEEHELRDMTGRAERLNVYRTTIFVLTALVSLAFLVWAYRRIRSEIVQRERAVAERAEKEVANRTKDQFLAVLSHELRTPLAPVLIAAQLLERDTRVPGEVRESAAMIRRNVELQARLVDDLLDVNRISHGKLELQLACVDLHERAHQVAEMCDSDARGKDLCVRLDLRADHHHVRADATRVQQVIWNLLRNAIKFTPDGGQIAIVTANARDGCISLSVRDTGPGIEPEILPRLFNAFEQGSKQVTRQFGGLGLGLSISKGLMDLHGGTLTAHSAGRGHGTTFTMELPTVAPPRVVKPVGPVAQAEPPLLKGGRILLVEDHADSARIMARLLETFGFSVVLADSMAGALRATQTEKFELVISDIGLPDGSGLDLMRQLRTRHPIRGIALSGYGMEDDIRRSKEAGFMAHVTKPVSLQKLDDVLHQICG